MIRVFINIPAYLRTYAPEVERWMLDPSGWVDTRTSMRNFTKLMIGALNHYYRFGTVRFDPMSVGELEDAPMLVVLDENERSVEPWAEDDIHQDVVDCIRAVAREAGIIVYYDKPVEGNTGWEQA